MILNKRQLLESAIVAPRMHLFGQGTLEPSFSATSGLLTITASQCKGIKGSKRSMYDARRESQTRECSMERFSHSAKGRRARMVALGIRCSSHFSTYFCDFYPHFY